MKVEFVDLTLKNFLSFGNKPQKIIFEKGVNIITGPNGSGKSSLSDSLSFCLFGKVLRDINQPDLVNWKNRKECVVSLNLKIGDTDYRIERGISPNFLEIYENGVEIKQSGKRDAQSQLEEILGFSFNTYSNLVYTNINFNTPILKMPPGLKRTFIEKIFQIEVFARLSENCKMKIKNMERRKNVLDSRIATINSLLNEYDEIIRSLSEELNKISSSSDKIKELKNNETKLLKEINKLGCKEEIERKLENHQNELRDLKEKILSSKHTIKTLEDEIEKLNNRILVIQNEGKCPTCENKIDQNKLKAKFTKKIEKIENEINEIEKTKNDLIKRANDIERNITEELEKLKLIDENESELKILKTEIEYLEKITKEEDEIKVKTETKREEYSKKKKELKRELEDAKSEKEIINSTLDYLFFIRDACKDDNIRQYAISSTLPLLNNLTNGYLSEVGFNFYVEIDKFIDVKIKGPGMYGSISNLSAGETKSIDLSIMMAFHDIARLKAKNYADIFISDEILDSSVDSSNISKIYKIIKTKQSKYDLKVYIISHRPEINDMDFDHVLEVKKEDGFSVVTRTR